MPELPIPEQGRRDVPGSTPSGKRPARIGLNLVYLVPGETGGMEVYARGLVPALADAAPGVRITAFVNRELGDSGQTPAWLEHVECRVVPVHASSRAQWVLGEQLPLPRLAGSAGIDLLHSLASTAPAWGRFRRVATVHDLIYARYPETHGGVRALGMRTLVPLAVRRSDRVITSSEATRSDLDGMLGTPTWKIDVVPLGIGSVAEPSTQTVELVRGQLDAQQRRVVLSPSAKRPHKNLMALLGALARIGAERRPVLVLPGYPTPHEQQLRDRAAQLGLANDVRILGWVDDGELEALWRLSDACVFPSLYEGFGLPVLEAMARGVPVACSNVSSLPEVAGDAALLFDPHDEAAIAASIERLLEDEATARRLRAAGRARASEFTWQRTAELTLLSYARAMGLSDVPQSWRQPR